MAETVDPSRLPDDPLEFIRACVRERNVYWTYHVNMRLRKRFISRQVIIDAVESYEIIEPYPDDKYLPSFLVYFLVGGQPHHAVFAVDTAKVNVRVVTAYRPDPGQWSDDCKRRLSP